MKLSPAWFAFLATSVCPEIGETLRAAIAPHAKEPTAKRSEILSNKMASLEPQLLNSVTSVVNQKIADNTRAALSSFSGDISSVSFVAGSVIDVSSAIVSRSGRRVALSQMGSATGMSVVDQSNMRCLASLLEAWQKGKDQLELGLNPSKGA